MSMQSKVQSYLKEEDNKVEKYLGRLFAFSGIDGSGKTTVIRSVSKMLSEKRISVAVFKNHEPYSVYWEVIKHIKHRCVIDGRPMNHETDRLLQSLELALKAKCDLPKLLVDNEAVLSDRYILDKAVYGVLNGEMGIAQSALNAIEIKPDLTFFLRVSVKTALERVMNRGKPCDWRETPEMLTKAVQIFEIELSHNTGVSCIIDAENAREKVAEDVFNVIIKSLKSHNRS